MNPLFAAGQHGAQSHRTVPALYVSMVLWMLSPALADTSQPAASKTNLTAGATDSATVRVIAPDDKTSPSNQQPAPLIESANADARDDLQSLRAPLDEARLNQMLRDLRCLVCQNQSLYDSQADLANDLKAYIVELMQNGLSDEEIRLDLVNKYGEFVLYQPSLRPSTWLLWIAPFALLVIGLLALVWFLSQRARPDPAEAKISRDNDGLS